MPDRPKFELGFALAGAISAGAYTAGVLDFLVEALDAWHADESCAHDVVLHNLSGASAGSVCAVILGALAPYDFAHVRLRGSPTPSPGIGANNPLFDSWVNRIDIKDLLEHRDLDGNQPALSLLDSTKLAEIAEAALKFSGTRITRRYVADPLRIRLTLTNLRGVPYRLSMQGATGEAHWMRMHTDHQRFALTGVGGAPVEPPEPIGDYRHEYPMALPPQGEDDKYRAWRALADAAIASAAFPVGLRARTINKDKGDYANLPVVIPGGMDQHGVLQLPAVYDSNPDWLNVPGGGFEFAVSDGGSMNNEPIELSRLALVRDRPLVRNSREGETADKAVILIDPFVGAIPEGPAKAEDAPLLKILFQLLGAYKNDARFSPADLALASRDGVYSRFLIAPDRGSGSALSNGRAIASGALAGFGGFLAWDFRAHDYFLGRRNCQRFLSAYFGLPETDKTLLFRQWPTPLKNRHRFFRPGAGGVAEPHLPIIPLVDALRPDDPARVEPLPAWPAGKCNLTDVMDRIDGRVDCLYDRISHEVPFLRSLALSIGWRFFGKDKVRTLVQERIESSLRDHRLLS